LGSDFNFPLNADRTGGKRVPLIEGDGPELARAGGVAAVIQGNLAAEQATAVKQLPAMLAAIRKGYAERQLIEDETFAEEAAYNRALIFVGAASSQAATGVKGLASLLWTGGSAAVNAAAFVTTEAIGLVSDIATGDIDALSRRANSAFEGVENLSGQVQRKLEGFRTIAAFATNPEVALQLGSFFKGIASDTSPTGWLLGGARFAGELALAAFTGGPRAQERLPEPQRGQCFPLHWAQASRGAHLVSTMPSNGFVS
jgi:hypothetical protein